MNNAIQQIVDVIKNDPAVDNVIAFTGGGGATNTGFIYIALKPLAERKVSAAQIIDRLRPKLNRLPVASAFLQAGAGSAHRRPRQQCACISTRSSPTTCRTLPSGDRSC